MLRFLFTMTMLRPFVFGLFLTSACVSRGGPQPASATVSVTTAAEVECEAGFSPMSLMYGSTAAQLPDGFKTPPGTNDFGLRLRICVNFNLEPAVISVKDASAAILGIPIAGARVHPTISGENIRVANLGKVLFFEPSIASFSMDIPLFDDFTLRLRGIDAADPSNNFIAGEIVKGDTRVLPADKRYGGSLIEGDPFSVCNLGYEAQRRFVQAGTARISVLWCFGGFSTSGGYPGYLSSLVVVDQNEKLGDLKGKVFSFKKEQFAGAVELKEHHHEICDSFQIALPHAKYQVTAGPAGAGSEQEYLDLCTRPQNNFVPNPKPIGSAPWTLVFRNLYTNASIDSQSGRSNVVHFVKDNPNIE